MKKAQLQSALNLSRAFLVLVFMLTLSPAALAQVDQQGAWDNGVTESWWLSSATFTNEEAAGAIDRWKRIGAAEQSGPATIWTGDYFIGGETHGTYIRWSPNAGFVIANVDKCQALVMGVTHGRVEVTPDLITFIPEFSKASKSHGHAHALARESTAITFVPVKWQDRLFLIRATEIADFTAYVVGLGDFNLLSGFDPLESSYFYSKYAGKDAVVYETPVVPESYQHFIRKPITGSIISIGNTRLKRNYSQNSTSKTFSFASNHVLASLTFVRVDVGSRDGAKAGLFLRISEPNVDDVIKLIRVGKASSTGVIVRDVIADAEYDNDNEAESGEPYPELAVGWKVTTTPRW